MSNLADRKRAIRPTYRSCISCRTVVIAYAFLAVLIFAATGSLYMLCVALGMLKAGFRPVKGFG